MRKDARASQSPQSLADEVGLLEQFDNCADTRNMLRAIAHQSDEWAGIPMPFEDEKLIIAPKFRWAHVINDSYKARKNKGPGGEEVKVRNVVWSKRHRMEFVIFEGADGKVRKAWLPGQWKLDAMMRTMACSAAWGIEQEHRALKLLGEMVPHHMFKNYLLSGVFMERSKRSDLVYIFRKLRPTVVLRSKGEAVAVLTTLCMHPIGYYEDTWAGAMCPTDDVIAHLSMMRSDEHAYWRRANQIPYDRPNAGL